VISLSVEHRFTIVAVHTALSSLTFTQEWTADSRATRHDKAPTNLLSSCGAFQINNSQHKDVLHVLGVGPNHFSIYYITHMNKKVEFWPNKWVVQNINDRFKGISSGYYDESEWCQNDVVSLKQSYERSGARVFVEVNLNQTKSRGRPLDFWQIIFDSHIQLI
jgi:hypothetical protein